MIENRVRNEMTFNMIKFGFFEGKNFKKVSEKFKFFLGKLDHHWLGWSRKFTLEIHSTLNNIELYLEQIFKKKFNFN